MNNYRDHEDNREDRKMTNVVPGSSSSSSNRSHDDLHEHGVSHEAPEDGMDGTGESDFDNTNVNDAKALSSNRARTNRAAARSDSSESETNVINDSVTAGSGYVYRDRSEEPPLENMFGKEPIATFPMKLHAILSNPEFSDIITWLPHGRAWRVCQHKAFEEKVIPLYFRHGRYSSFARQVNGWNFRRITHGSDYNAYYHELFLRGLPHLCERMKRLSPSDLKKIKKDDAPLPSFYAIARAKPLPTLPAGNQTPNRAAETGEQDGNKSRSPTVQPVAVPSFFQENAGVSSAHANVQPSNAHGLNSLDDRRSNIIQNMISLLQAAPKQPPPMNNSVQVSQPYNAAVSTTQPSSANVTDQLRAILTSGSGNTGSDLLATLSKALGNTVSGVAQSSDGQNQLAQSNSLGMNNASTFGNQDAYNNSAQGRRSGSGMRMSQSNIQPYFGSDQASGYTGDASKNYQPGHAPYPGQTLSSITPGQPNGINQQQQQQQQSSTNLAESVLNLARLVGQQRSRNTQGQVTMNAPSGRSDFAGSQSHEQQYGSSFPGQQYNNANNAKQGNQPDITQLLQQFMPQSSTVNMAHSTAPTGAGNTNPQISALLQLQKQLNSNGQSKIDVSSMLQPASSNKNSSEQRIDRGVQGNSAQYVRHEQHSNAVSGYGQNSNATAQQSMGNTNLTGLPNNVNIQALLQQLGSGMQNNGNSSGNNNNNIDSSQLLSLLGNLNNNGPNNNNNNNNVGNNNVGNNNDRFNYKSG